MSDLLTTKTVGRLHEIMEESGAASMEQLVQMALQSLDSNLCSIEPDDETWDAIDRAESQPDISIEEAERRIFNRVRGKTFKP